LKKTDELLASEKANTDTVRNESTELLEHCFELQEQCASIKDQNTALHCFAG
jgi:hypothetical protein